MVVGVHPKRRCREPPIVTLKIERFRERVRLSGDLRSEDLDQVETEIERCGTSAVLDVEEVALVARRGSVPQPMRGERRRCVELSGLYQGVDVKGKNSPLEST